jgi:C-terminal processing protease CtpA/Prc
MKKILLLAASVLLFIQCNSVKNHNQHLADLKTQKQLKYDVDYAYKKLQDLHPDLYWYISKADLDYKFDSLKATIDKPMTGLDFYKKISPVIASVRQGHMSVIPDTKWFTKRESKALVDKGIGPFSQFEFDIFNGKIYVIKNKSYDKSIKPGSEVVAINNTNLADLLKRYAAWFTSDGFNQTFKNTRLGKNFPLFYSNENGIQDSLVYSFKYHDSIQTAIIKRRIVDSVKTDTGQKPEKKRITAAEKEKLKAEKKKKALYGYNEMTKLYNRNLKFTESDSSIAIMKIHGFSIGNASAFYKQSFEKISQYKTKTLIIDIRDNPGGSLYEIADLYGYLSDSTYVFSDKSEVASKTSLLHADYLKGGSLGTKALKAVFAPLYYGYMFFKVHKNEDGKFYYSTTDSKPHQKKTEAFNGKVYVLINGGSFSASCILSSNLKGSKRAYFVGQETGGAYNGTVAGRMPIITLPNSKIQVHVGLMLIAPHYKSEIEGRGIFPDKEIIPTLQDRLTDNDPEMNWVMEDIKKAKADVYEASTK